MLACQYHYSQYSRIGLYPAIYSGVLMTIETLAGNLQRLQDSIEECVRLAGRPSGEARLVAVTKGRPMEWAQWLQDLGIEMLGESFLREFKDKVEAMPDAKWHYIGRLRRSEVNGVVGKCDLIHSVASLKVLQKIAQSATRLGIVQPLLLQVNTSGEEAKQGLAPKELAQLFDQGAHMLEGVEVRGLMTMAPFSIEEDKIRDCFSSLRQLSDEMNKLHGSIMPELSMGMTNDYKLAIEEGATLVRIGSALYVGLEDTCSLRHV